MVDFDKIFPVVKLSIEELDMLWQLSNYKDVVKVAEILEKEYEIRKAGRKNK